MSVFTPSLASVASSGCSWFCLMKSGYFARWSVNTSGAVPETKAFGNNITNAFVSGTAPDVFTDHLAKYPDFIKQNQLQPLDATLAKDGVKTDIYQKGLADLWVGPDGARYGLPKDFDTTALFYNKQLIQAAGVSAAQLQDLTWNPSDGGSYET